ncbi:MAG TPA: type II secretion system major pseudopilin GspG [Pseudomonadales bacterium]
MTTDAVMTMRARQAGFSLIEIMVVLVILGILASLVAPQIMGNVDRALVQQAKSDIKSIETALKLYKLDNFNYPTTEQGLQALVSKTGIPPLPKNFKAEGYLDRLPKDPWGNDYFYLSPGEHGEFDIYTLGRDGNVGGDGQDADIGNWASE